jgi:hypothetical protein
MYLTLYMDAGKTAGQSLMAARDTCPVTSRRLFVRDKASGIRFLVDTGADICVFPRQLVPSRLRKSDYTFSAANGTPIATYGTRTITLNLGLRRDFCWRFLVADVSKPILGADFLAHHNPLPDLTHCRLVDSITHLTFRGELPGPGNQDRDWFLDVPPADNAPRRLPRCLQNMTRCTISSPPLGPQSHKNRDVWLLTF